MTIFLILVSVLLGACMLLVAVVLLPFRRFRSHALAILVCGSIGGLAVGSLYVLVVVAMNQAPLYSPIVLAVFAAGFGWAGLLGLIGWSLLRATRFPARWIDRRRARG